MLSKKQRRLNKHKLFTASTNGRRRTVAKTQRCYSHLSSCCLQAIRWTRELNLKTLAKPDGMLPQYTVYCNPLPPVILSIMSLSLKFEPFSNRCGKKKKKKSAFLARVMSWMNLNTLPWVLWLKRFPAIFPEVGTTWKNNIAKLLYFL